MRGSTPACPTTGRRVSDPVLARRLALVPGVGHLLLGHRTKGMHLLAYALGAVAVLWWRWDRVAGALGARVLDQWVAVLFLFGSLLGVAM